MKNVLMYLFTFTLILSVSVFTACSDDDEPSEKEHSAVKVEKKNNTALLLCSFGSTYQQPQATYDQIIADYKAAYPNTDIYMSFTSRTIVSRVFNQIGIAYAQPDLWLSAIAKSGYEKVYIQSLHIIPGEEYLSLMNTDVKKNFMIPNPNIVVAKSPCLLDTEEDVTEVAKVLYSYYKELLNKGEVVALMGHGNPDTEYTHANTRYDQLEVALQKLSGKKNIFIGTVDWGEKMFSHIREEIKAFAKRESKEYKDVVVNLAPLMSIAGDHAQNDLLGGLEDGQTMDKVNPDENDWDAEYSWKLKLEKLGFTISTNGSVTDEKGFNVIGLGDHKNIRKIWINHMADAVKNAESWSEHLPE
ncbi:sirohydrochlorin cobaltochelatase [Dysgonomonas sp. Marseille-P4677]|uniref:sirohydrochlorin cobaltochelatase n=1 Tax=Dysgonomonas sp. Marseille-P4677 TaxID=2364790 RepID=UPI001911DBAA|nr:sirohydrochlorin cobaltochelatase [Dysgonomonas sp. Marseille-P4677]MBK5722845.1 sirohydrochlorin cobaltochelatase [Dysgonomonas sp. Marseille-P4677]